VVTLIKYALQHPDKSTFYQRAFFGLLRNVINIIMQDVGHKFPVHI
jgi:hypothetical protein